MLFLDATTNVFPIETETEKPAVERRAPCPHCHGSGRLTLPCVGCGSTDAVYIRQLQLFVCPACLAKYK